MGIGGGDVFGGCCFLYLFMFGKYFFCYLYIFFIWEVNLFFFFWGFLCLVECGVFGGGWGCGWGIALR